MSQTYCQVVFLRQSLGAPNCEVLAGVRLSGNLIQDRGDVKHLEEQLVT